MREKRVLTEIQCLEGLLRLGKLSEEGQEKLEELYNEVKQK